MEAKDMFGNLGSIIASLMFVWAMFQQYVPYQLQHNIEKYCQILVRFAYPYIQIRFDELTGDYDIFRSEAYTAIQTYLSSRSSTQAKMLKADIAKNSQSLALRMDDHEEVADEFKGVKLWWASGKEVSNTPSWWTPEEKRYYRLTCHKQHRDLILGPYLDHVLKEAKAMEVRNRQRKLYTNNGTTWSHVMLKHPAKFQTLAMDPEKKKEIMDDLIEFSKAEEFYERVGRAWKRGYLLYGPPGTGKSSMIAAMANLLSYDLYDLELTSVKNNTDLRKLLMEVSSKSIIVIEDIDCSLDLTGQRKTKKKKEKDEEEEKKDPKQKKEKEEKETEASKVTLSGLLNFIDGLWSACGGERLIVFTTNYMEKLDPALIRSGRMDKHIELSYCRFEAFKGLAKNYLKIESHPLFGRIRELLEEANLSPADVAEHLMPKKASGDPTFSLESLIKGLEKAKEEARLKAEEEARLKAKEEAKKIEQPAKEEAKKVEQPAKEEAKHEDKAVTENGEAKLLDARATENGKTSH
ncbi:AAA-ATPase At3g28510-like [Corylus avellana]|uniref:AAA-ATPase At3g28510-like n=1 Tax=Corylus avellana TaxID=13451 RepID=UPI001E218133|nr:AAA-ATPase At3g28510-like [Corylus avellana]